MAVTSRNDHFGIFVSTNLYYTNINLRWIFFKTFSNQQYVIKQQVYFVVVFNSLYIEPPHINGSEEPVEISVIVNNPLELTCFASGIPTPKITWMKDGRPLPQTDQVQTLGGGEVLRISSAQVSVEVKKLFHPGLSFSLANIGKMEKLCFKWIIDPSL